MVSRFIFSFLIPLLTALSVPLSASGAITLQDSFFSALKANQNENLNHSLIIQSHEVRKQFRGNYYPVISGFGTYLKQENMHTDQKAIGVNLSHELYSGGRKNILVEGADRDISIAENQKIVDRLNLYSNVIEAYYNYFLNLNDYKNLELLKIQSKERVDETKKRVTIGRSRKGELLQAEAQLATADAQILNGVGLIKETGNRFYVLTGLDRQNQSFDLDIIIPSDSNDMNFYLETAYKRPDVISHELKIEKSDLDIKYSKSEFLPTLNLDSNYYINRRSGSFHNTTWDVGLVLHIPIYEGGSTSALVNQNIEKKQQAIYTLSDYKKNIELDITSRYETFHRYLDQIKAFDSALEKTKKSYEETVRDYRLGLVSNLDVLTSLNTYLDSKRNSEKTKILAMMNLKLLEASAGVLP